MSLKKDHTMKNEPPRRDEWRKLFQMRDDLSGEDRMLLRKLIHYAEHLEHTLKAVRALLNKQRSGTRPNHDEGDEW
jgi:hypothetical protein